ncbi:MAG: TrkA family potassium uptake protein [Clostridia bacterium]|nr:TrkA family potassium uptake protein [Clostridia bacterium]
MRIILIGASQLGYFLAKHLLEAGHDVRLIDADKARCALLANTFDVPVYCGDGTRVETLAQAGAGKSDVLIAVTNRDEDNLIACEIGKKQFGIARTISRSNNHKNIMLMKRLGVDVVLDTTRLITELIEHELDGSEVKFIADISNSDAVIGEFHIPETWSRSGSRVMDLEVPQECVLIYVMRGGMFLIPRGGTLLMAGDDVVALTVGGATKKLKRMFEIGK